MIAAVEIVDRVSEARSVCVADLDGVASLLSQTRGALGELQSVLGDLLSSSGERSLKVDPLVEIDGALASLRETLDGVAGKLTTDKTLIACRGLTQATLDTNRTSLEFRMHATLTAITVASMRERNQQLEAYVESLVSIGANLTQISGQVSTRIKRTIAARAEALMEFEEAAADFDELGRALAVNGGRAVRAPRPQGAGGARPVEAPTSELDAAASKLDVQTRLELGRLVEMLQFTDAFAQRSAHVAEALKRAETAPASRAKAIYGVCLAQSEDMLGNMRKTCAALTASLQSFATEAQAAREIFDRKVQSGDLQEVLAARARSLEMAIRNVRRIAPRFDAIAVKTNDIIGTSLEIRTSLDDLATTSGEIMLASVNAGLIASRMSAAGGPLAILAATAQEQSMGSSSQIRETMAHFHTLIATVDDVDIPGLKSALDGFSATAERLNTEAREVLQKTMSLDATSDRVAQILVTIETVSETVGARLETVQDTLGIFEQALQAVRNKAEWIEVAPEDRETVDLSDLRALYTMQIERNIHDRELGIEAEPVPEAVPVDAENLDDILF